MKVKKREVKNKYVIKNGKKLGKLGWVIKKEVKLKVRNEGVRKKKIMIGEDKILMKEINKIYVGLGNESCGMLRRK